MLQHVVTDYFRLVRYGYATGNLLGFLREVSAPDVMFNTEYSPEAIDQHWCLSQWFGNVEVEVESFQKSSCHSLVVATITKMTITRETLRNVFPHLRTTDNSAHNCKLVEKLLNQRLAMRGSTCFVWDRSSCCLTRVLTQNDMLTPMLNLLGNLEDVARVFNKALISPAF
ncbi:hypothetical protein P3T76_006309 [Phytophthora citrophthora]|uniref:Uncharacterized protein n=1 Tax=Phytophthora citrophthora TaxID=4793 RepID=A0AAD9GNS8_9STRA|nr:hypothetical protein P3T76_006309 [Phytophthora citrophthora]